MAEELVEVRVERVPSSSSSLSSKVAPIQHEINSSNTTKSQDLYHHHHLQDSSGVTDRSIQELNAQDADAWLPITESRKGSSWTATFHLLCSGIGIQSFALPLAFVSLGWFWGSFCLALIYAWQLYTMWLLVQLHESSSGSRYSRYLQLSIIAFGERLGKLIAIFPVMYLSGGACVMFIINGGGTMELFYQAMMRGEGSNDKKLLSGAEWFLVFICLAIVLALFFPNLNSLARVSLVGSVAALASCTLIWTLSITKQRPQGVFHDPSKAAKSDVARFRDIFNALGIIALAFRGHNLVLEIQGTMPTSPVHPSRKHMWKGVTISYSIIATCLFPLAIGGYWAYGNMMASTGGILSAFSKFHDHNTSKFVMGTVYLIVLIQYLSAFQIYAMPTFDNWERIYTSKKNKPCPRWLRSALKLLFGGLTYFVAVALPFLGLLGAFVGAIALPLTLAYPCFMWISIKKPRNNSIMWSLNMVLGSLGVIMSVLLAAAALWNLIANGLDANFFKPR